MTDGESAVREAEEELRRVAYSRQIHQEALRILDQYAVDKHLLIAILTHATIMTMERAYRFELSPKNYLKNGKIVEFLSQCLLSPDGMKDMAELIDCIGAYSCNVAYNESFRKREP